MTSSTVTHFCTANVWCTAVLHYCYSAASKKADKTAAVTLRDTADMDLDDDTTATSTTADSTANATRLPLAYLALAAALAPSLVSCCTYRLREQTVDIGTESISIYTCFVQLLVQYSLSLVGLV
jgi:hypothetical protein